MADEHLTAKDARFFVFNIAPDVCLTPSKSGYPVPYPIGHLMSESEQCSANVFSNGKPVFLHKMSYVDNVHGNEPGMGGGVVTRVNMKISHSNQHSSNLYVNGHPVVRTGDIMHMNTKKP